MNKKILYSLLFATSSLAAQSPWPRSKAGFFLQAAWQTIPEYAEIFEPENEAVIPLDRELAENTFQLYGEYGLSKRTTLVAVMPLRFVKNGAQTGNFEMPETEEGSLAGMGNISIGVRQAILEGRLRLSGTLRLDFPGGNYDDAKGLRTGYDAWTLQPSLSTGMGLGKVYWYAYAGFGFRSNDYSHYLNTGGELGVKLWRFWLIGFSDLVYSMENGNVELPLRQRIQNLYVDRQGWWALGAKTVFEANRFWGVTASFSGAGWAQFVPKSPAVSAGVYFKWD